MFKRFLILSAVIIGFFAIEQISAQTPQRIQFARGKNSATVKGTTGTSGVYYVIGAKSGQKLTLTLSPTSKVGIKVETDDGQNVLLREENGGIFQIDLDQNSDFSIFVGSTNHKSISFTLTVKITG